MSQPKISRHLAYLRKAGIATARREGKWMHYRLAVPKDAIAASVLQETLKHLREKPDMKRDISRLGVAACSPQKFELPERVPQPALISIRPAQPLEKRAAGRRDEKEPKTPRAPEAADGGSKWRRAEVVALGSNEGLAAKAVADHLAFGDSLL